MTQELMTKGEWVSLFREAGLLASSGFGSVPTWGSRNGRGFAPGQPLQRRMRRMRSPRGPQLPRPSQLLVVR